MFVESVLMMGEAADVRMGALSATSVTKQIIKKTEMSERE